MTYVYDVLLNFTDESRLIYFFEWRDSDYIDHVKKIPFFRVSSDVLDDIIRYNIKFSKKFVSSIKGLTELYKSCNELQYSFLISDLNKVIGVELDSKGNIISRSTLLLQEEEEVIDEVRDSGLVKLDYSKGEISFQNEFLTRDEIYKRNILLNELENSYKLEEYDKINFYFQEIYNNSNKLSINERFNLLKRDITNNYSNKYDRLYNLICMVHKNYKGV